MNQINYEAEVLRVYPDAVYVYFPYSRHGKHHIRRYPQSGMPISIGTSKAGEAYAWESAFNTLKQQGKL